MCERIIGEIFIILNFWNFIEIVFLSMKLNVSFLVYLKFKFYVYFFRDKVKFIIKIMLKCNIVVSFLSLRSRIRECLFYMCYIMMVGNFFECGFLGFLFL